MFTDSTSGHPNASAIDCHDATVRFRDGSIAVDHVRLTIRAGEIMSLIGPSGCGKTTLLRSIAGLQRLDEGGVTFQPPARAEEGQIGFVFQQPALLPWASTLENVTLPLELIHRGSSRQRRESAIRSLASVRLQDALQKRPDELSGGMQMRASIARALVTGPGVLLLDEPFAALDDMLRSELGRLLLNLWEARKFTAVMVTHNISESIWLSHRIAVMRSGVIETVVNNPLPWPRDPAMMRSADFAQFFGVVSDLLRGDPALSGGEEVT